jgi:hypothetical protein
LKLLQDLRPVRQNRRIEVFEQSDTPLEGGLAATQAEKRHEGSQRTALQEPHEGLPEKVASDQRPIEVNTDDGRGLLSEPRRGERD